MMFKTYLLFSEFRRWSSSDKFLLNFNSGHILWELDYESDYYGNHTHAVFRTVFGSYEYQTLRGLTHYKEPLISLYININRYY